MDAPHIPVLLKEVKDAFSSLDEGYFIDCTLGYGGHTEAILEAHPHLHVIGCDRDAEAIAFAKKRLERFGERVRFVHRPFSEIADQLDALPVRGILADIGVSSLQLDKVDRGFGLDSNTLDMRMDSRQALSAYDVVNTYSQEELEEILREYGELREWRLLAKKICDAREHAPITSSKVLADLAGRGGKYGRKVSPAILLFQAIRIEVNDELGELSRLLDAIKQAHLKDCLVGIISFHSLEDRIVKRTFKTWKQNCICGPEVFRCECGNNHALGKAVTKKPIEPSAKEIKVNPRSRSSKFRVFHIEGRDERS